MRARRTARSSLTATVESSDRELSVILARGYCVFDTIEVVTAPTRLQELLHFVEISDAVLLFPLFPLEPTGILFILMQPKTVSYFSRMEC